MRIKHRLRGHERRRSHHVDYAVLHVPRREPDVRAFRRVAGKRPNAHRPRRAGAAALALASRTALLQALGVQPTSGRWFTEAEHEPAAEGPQPVLLSYAFWQRRFGGDEAALERELSIDSRPARIVGIMPRDFRFLDLNPQPDMIVPWQLDRCPARHRQFRGLTRSARLKPGVTPAEARADIERMLPIWIDAWPLIPGIGSRAKPSRTGKSPRVSPLKDELMGNVASTLWVLMGAIGAVLLDRMRQHRESHARPGGRSTTRVRRARSAGRGSGANRERVARRKPRRRRSRRCARLGARARWPQALIAIGPSNLPRLQEISIDPTVLSFSRRRFARVDARCSARSPRSSTRGSRRAVIGGARAARARAASAIATRNTLVVVQVALAIVLVVSAALMIRTFQALRDVDPGFSDPATIQMARIWMPTTPTPDPERYMRMQHEILDRIAATSRRGRDRFCEPASDGGRANRHGGARGQAKRCRQETRRRRADSSSSHPATLKPWARESSRDATSLGPTSKRAARGPDFREFRARARAGVRRPRPRQTYPAAPGTG